MHVLVLPSWYPLNDKDLNGSFFREQSKAVARKGVKVGVLIPQFRTLRLGLKAILGRYDQEVWQDEGLVTYFQHGVAWFPRVPYLDLNRWTKAGLSLFERYVKEQGVPDLLHVHSMTDTGLLALKIHRKYGIPYCITEHSTLFARGLIRDWQWKYLREIETSASKLLAVSQDLANLLEKKLTGRKWEYFPNLLDKLFVKKQPEVMRKKQFCAVAFLHPKKGFDNLIKAFSKVVKEYPDWQLVIGGEGAMRTALETLITELSLERNVKLLGACSREQVCELMGESECFVLSSHFETFGVVVIEALSQGTPVISTLCGGPESILKEGDGLFVKVNDIDDLARGMFDFLRHKNSFNNAEIRQRCIDTYSEPVFARNLITIYKDILEKK